MLFLDPAIFETKETADIDEGVMVVGDWRWK